MAEGAEEKREARKERGVEATCTRSTKSMWLWFGGVTDATRVTDDEHLAVVPRWRATTSDGEWWRVLASGGEF